MGAQPGQPWFRIGRLEVGTTMLVVLLVVASWLAWVVAPNVVSAMVYSPWSLTSGAIWQVVTWPFANSLSLFGLLNLFFFWMFGTELEQQLGRNKMAVLLGGIWASMTAVSTLFGLALHSYAGLAGIGMIQFVVLLIWIADNPRRPFFFGIPAWVVGAVLVAFQVLQLIAARAMVSLLILLVSFAVIAVLARRLGLLSDYAWIPGRSSGRRRVASVQKAQAKVHEQRAKDDARLDALLEQIADKGIDSLSAKQRRELMELRNRH